MTAGWVKLPSNWLASDAVEALGADAVLLHLSALSYSCSQLSDGDLPRGAVRKLWPAGNVEQAVEALEDAGHWRRTSGGWHLVDWATHLLAADEVESRRRSSAESSERYRRHKAGDHSMCSRCTVVRAGDASHHASVTSLGSARLGSARNGVESRDETEGGEARPSAAASGPASPDEDAEWWLLDDWRCPHGALIRFNGAEIGCRACRDLGVGPELFEIAERSRGDLVDPKLEDWLHDQLTERPGYTTDCFDGACGVARALCDVTGLPRGTATRTDVALVDAMTYIIYDRVRPGHLAGVVKAHPDAQPEGADRL